MEKTRLAILSFVLILALSTPAEASRVSLVPAISDMGVCKASFTNQLLRATNVGPVTDTYKLTSDSNMITFAGCDRGSISNNEVVLAAGESALCAIFVNPLNSTESRLYRTAIKASSLSSSDSSSAPLGVEVLSCNAVSLTTQGSVKACARDRFATSVVVRNAGKSAETFNLFADTPGTFDKNPVRLAAGQSVVVGFEASYGNISSKKIKFDVKSLDSFASAESVLDVAVNECFTFAASLKPDADAACLRKPASLTLEITNTGEKQDVYVIDGQKQVSLKVSENYTVKITASSKEEGKFKTAVSVKSVGSDTVRKVTTDINVKECGVIGITPASAKASACKGDGFVYGIDVKNLGNITESYNLSSTLGSLDVNKLLLEPGGSRRVSIGVNTTAFVENRTYAVVVAVSAGTLKKTANISLEIPVCHSASLRLVPQSLSVCMPEKAEFKVDLENTGKKSDTFSLFAAGKQIARNILMPEGASKSVNFTADYANETGLYRVDVRALSENTEAKATGALVVNDYNVCYGSEIKTKNPRKDITPTDRNLEELQLRNTGLRTLNYIMQVMGPSWMAVGISNMTLEPNETAKIYLYIAPPFGTKIGNYDTKVIAISDKGIVSSASFAANVVGSTTTTLKAVNVTTTLPAAPGGQRNLLVIGIILAVAAVLILRYIFAG